ncbi:MAG TPA: VOC family protein [Chryseolinea sp.]|nr:VOC family protein [Chryseolinea sp.]
MDNTTNSLNWFEIPALDLARARHFYQTIFGIHMEEQNPPNMQMALFPQQMGSGKASGAVVQSMWHKPSLEGAIVYLNANPAMDPVLEKIEASGGKITMAKTMISSEIGYMAFFVDTEGNAVALHSQK